MTAASNTTSSTQTLSSLVGDLGSLSTSLNSLSGVLAFMEKETQILTSQKVNAQDLHPFNAKGGPVDLIMAGDQKIETKFHWALKEGGMLETSMGDALTWVQNKKLEWEKDIENCFDLNKLAVDGKLPTFLRSPKYAKDSVEFLRKIRQYTLDVITMVTVIEANIALLQAMETQLLSMIQANINCVTNLLREVCNWGLPGLPSMLARLGGMWHWAGFNFTSISGFKLTPIPRFSFDFSFNQCSIRIPDLARFFDNGSAGTIVDDTLPLTPAQPILPPQASLADPARYSDPAYIVSLRDNRSLVFDPVLIRLPNSLSLPQPTSIVSNYSLPAAMYTENVVSAVSSLNSAVIQPGDPDYATGAPSASRQQVLRGSCVSFVTLGQISASGFDANLTAAWLLYLDRNRTGRAGTWLSRMEAEYLENVQPSIDYLHTTPVPWNQVLGSATPNNAPTAIPLIDALRADSTGNLFWRLSYIEAALLGYTRNSTWDAAADSIFLGSFTGSSLDYVPTVIEATPTTEVTLGGETATRPVTCAYPQSIAGVLANVIAIASGDIAATPGFESVHPQYRYVYNMFSEASLIDRYTQFWREFNANLEALLAADPYVLSFAVTYTPLLNSAINPLADPSLHNALLADANSRNRAWRPGAELLTIPTVLELGINQTPPTSATTGWSTNNDGTDTFNATAYLARPDVQAQSIPTQIAMLRTNQTYASLARMGANIRFAVAITVANARATTQTCGAPGWEVECGIAFDVPPGDGVAVPYSTIDFDTASFVQPGQQSVRIAKDGAYALAVTLNWDPAGATGLRTLSILKNGVVVDSVQADLNSPSPFTTQYSGQIDCIQGDLISTKAAHESDTPQSILAGSSFMGLGNTTTTSPSTAGSAISGTLSLVADTQIPIYTAVSGDANSRVTQLDMAAPTTGQAPWLTGISLSAASAGQPVTVAMAYGARFQSPGKNWTPGGLIYLTPQATLTQDYASVAEQGGWLICVGQALSPSSFQYAPHAPTPMP